MPNLRRTNRVASRCTAAVFLIAIPAKLYAQAPEILSAVASPTTLPAPVTPGSFTVELDIGYVTNSASPDTLFVSRRAPEGTTTVIQLDGIDTLGFFEEVGNGNVRLTVDPSWTSGQHVLELVLRDTLNQDSQAYVLNLDISVGEPPPIAVESVSVDSVEPDQVFEITGTGFSATDGSKFHMASKPLEVITETSGGVLLKAPSSPSTGHVCVVSLKGVACSLAPVNASPSLSIGFPPDVEVARGTTINVPAIARGMANQRITWSVNGILGGNETIGNIDPYGNYSAPNSTGSVQVTARVPTIPPVEAGLTVHIVDGCIQRAVGDAPPFVDTTITSENRLASITVHATESASRLSLSASRRHYAEGDNEPLPGLASDRNILGSFIVESDFAQPPPGTTFKYRLPQQLNPGEPIELYHRDSPSVDFAMIDSPSLSEVADTASGTVPSLGEYVLVRRRPTESLPPLFAILSISVPPELNLVPASGQNMVKEGLTLPVLISGDGYLNGATDVSVSDIKMYDSDGNLAQTPDIDSGVPSPLVVGVRASSNGDELGFALEIPPLPWLPENFTLYVEFAVARWGPSGPDTLKTSIAQFGIHGLPELILDSPSTGCLYSLDGTRIDGWIEDSPPNCLQPSTGCYSTLEVHEGLTLGIGRPINQVFTQIDPSNPTALAIFAVPTIQEYEDTFGRLTWDTVAASACEVFAPIRQTVHLSVTNDVEIRGALYLAGAPGNSGDSGDSLDSEEQAQRAILGRVGGVVADRGSPMAHRSGGKGGLGGIEFENGPGGEPAAGPGLGSGDGFPPAGHGRDAIGNTVHIDGARGGVGVNEVEEAIDPWIQGLVNVALAIVSVKAGVPAAKEAYEKLRSAAVITDESTRAGRILGFFKEAANTGLPGAAAFLTVKSLVLTPTALSDPNSIYMNGEGGHPGVIPASFLSLNPLITSGAGGGGGGGGGATTIYTKVSLPPIEGLFDFSTTSVGGGGAGGGGAAGSLRVTSAGEIRISPAIAGYDSGIVADGGPGGQGQRHVLFAGAGGGGGGGAGANIKLQAPSVQVESDIDASGGLGGAGLTQSSGLLLPGPGFVAASSAQMGEMLDGHLRGSFIRFVRNQNDVHLFYPTGRWRDIVPMPFPVAGAGSGYNSDDGIFDGLLFVSPDRLIRKVPPPDMWGGFIDLSSIAVTSNALAPMTDFIPTDVAQNPLPPYEIFVSGYVNDTTSTALRPGVHRFADSMLYRFTASGTYIGPELTVATCDTCVGDTQGHLTSISFRSDGRIVLMMARAGATLESGLHSYDPTTMALTFLGTSIPVFRLGTYSSSFAVLRGIGEEIDVVSIFSASATLCSPNTTGSWWADNGCDGPRLFRFFADTGESASDYSPILDTLGIDADPGNVRIDGMAACSRPPVVKRGGWPLLPSEYLQRTYRGPVISGLGDDPLVLVEQSVFTAPQVLVRVGGGGPFFRPGGLDVFEVRPCLGSSTCFQQTDSVGEAVVMRTLSPGFNMFEITTTTGGPPDPLLRKFALFLQ